MDKQPYHPVYCSEYFTLSGFAAIRGVKIDINDARRIEDAAIAVSEEYGYLVGRHKNGIGEDVNTYHIEVLGEVMTP